MHQLEQLMIDSIATGLKRRSVTTCSKWACSYREMGNPFRGRWTFDHHPWLREMHDDPAEEVVGQKGAQVGFTEWAMNTTFYSIDVLNVDVLYVLPTNDDALDFTSGRFDPALENSQALKTLFSDVHNAKHKRAGQNSLYIRGSRSRSKLKSIPCEVLIFDEVDEMVQDNIPLALYRSSGQLKQKVLFISTPTIEDEGINKRFKLSDQRYFFFRCPCCNKLITFIYPDSLIITADELTDPKINDSHYICTECKGTLHHNDKINFLAKGKYVPTHKNRDVHGYTISQMFSSAIGGRPAELAKLTIKAETSPTEATELYNSKLGITYEAKGARLTETDINSCIGDYVKGTGSHHVVTMGIDVGTFFHYEIDEWILPNRRTPGFDVNDDVTCRLLAEGNCKDTIELINLFREYRVMAGVIDKYPEQRVSRQFATHFRGRILMCIYGRGFFGKQVQLGVEDELTITVDRTSWMDLSLGRIRHKTISLPRDISREYRNHLRAPVRLYEKDANGHPVGRYVSKGTDHLAHARTYSEIALPQAFSFGRSQNIRKPR